jgi:guanylate kinase
MDQGKLIVFSAPSGSGKTSIVKHLLKQPELNLDFSISATSRPQRANELEGQDYYFLNPEQFEYHITREEFIEYKEVYTNNYYGTLKNEVKRIWEAGKHVIFDIDVIGGMEIKEKYPNRTLTVFVKPPSLQEAEKRLRGRKTDTEEKIKERLEKAEAEMKYEESFDVVLMNDDFETAKKEACQLVHNFLNLYVDAKPL